jgi:hypothetical protein
MDRILSHFSLCSREREWFERHSLCLGDLHNHCGISYGYGTLSEAIIFAKQQLDFFAVTGHFAWPDMEEHPECPIPPEVVRYHKDGFAKLRRNWPEYLRMMHEATSDHFIPFPSYEYHSFTHGDYAVLCKEQSTELPESVPEGIHDDRLENLIETNDPLASGLLPIPHHIGYKTGFRGINWKTYNSAATPMVEILSMHGCAESQDALLSYLHTMGPLCGENTMIGGLSLGKTFGVCANTDHHNASPGSYGFGRTGAWTERLDRDSLWNSFCGRKTIALSGDKIEAMIFVDEQPMGSILPQQSGKHKIDAYVAGLDALSSMELVMNGQVLARFKPSSSESGNEFHGFIGVSIGWGKKHAPCHWNVTTSVKKGTWIGASPRLRGKDLVDPLDAPENMQRPTFSSRTSSCVLTAMTDGNTTATTDTTQGFVVELEGTKQTVLVLDVEYLWNGIMGKKHYEYTIEELSSYSQSVYLDGFVSPAMSIFRATPIEETLGELHEAVETNGRSWVYLRSYQYNKDMVVTSPVWF